MNELIINNRSVDLSDSTNIGVTLCANNIGELQNRQGNFTNTFKIPTSKNNKEIFEWSHLQTSSSLMPYNKLKATYRQNGIEIISDGIAEISNVDNNFFYVNVYSGNTDLLESIGDLKVGELYENDDVNVWNLDNSYYNALDYCIFPLIGWRKDIDFFTTNTIDVRQMLPTAKMPSLFSRLSSKIGYIFTGNYLNSSDHLNMVLTPNNFTIPSTDAIKTSQPLSTIGTTGGTLISSGSSVSTVTYLPTFRNENNITEFAFGDYRPTINKVGKLNFSATYQIKWRATEVKNNENTKDCFVKISFIDDLNYIVYTETVKTLSFDKKQLISEVFTIDIESPEFTFLSARRYRVQIDCLVQQKNVNTQFLLYEYEVFKDTGSPIGFFSPGSTTTNVFPRFYQFTPSPKIAFGSDLSFVNLFTMKVKDVLKDILNLRAIIIQTNNYTKTISFNSFEDLKVNKSIAKDWSSKIQNSSSMFFRFGNYAKKNNFLFKEDSDKTANADTNNDYYFNLSSDNLEDERTVVKLAHPTTMIFNRYNGYVIPRIDGLKNDTNEWLKSDWRILNLKLQSTDFDVNYTDGTTTVVKTTNIPFCEVIGFEKLVPKYYSTIQSIVEAPKVLKIVAKLNVNDISDLDFSIPIQIQRPDLNLSGYFYINKIENYKGGLTSCEIIEI